MVTSLISLVKIPSKKGGTMWLSLIWSSVRQWWSHALFTVTLSQPLKCKLLGFLSPLETRSWVGRGRGCLPGPSPIGPHWNAVLSSFCQQHSVPFPHVYSDCPSLVSFCPFVKNKDFYSSIQAISGKVLCKVEGLQLHSSSRSSVLRRHNHYFYLLLETFAEVKKNLCQGWKLAGGAEINIRLPVGLSCSFRIQLACGLSNIQLGFFQGFRCSPVLRLKLCFFFFFFGE